MRLTFFVHSVVSDWNNGNAHFLRGVVRELQRLGHDVLVCEPEDGWSRTNLVADHGRSALDRFTVAFPEIAPVVYGPRADVASLVAGSDAVVVHEWSPPSLVRAIGRSGIPALFHDTHHRSITAPEEMRRYDLDGYAGVLTFGEAIASVYRDQGRHDHVYTWHEAADVELFRPREAPAVADVTWIGNWGDGERTRELRTFLLEPSARLGLRGSVYGVRYPAAALREVRRAGLQYGGWLANHRVPDVFARHRVTVHVPRRPYAERLPGIPTIRVFEALACGIPLVSAPWEDAEGLFSPGSDYLVARNGNEMRAQLENVLRDDELADELTRSGRRAVLARHTCRHRAEELVAILAELGVHDRPAEVAA